MHFLSLCFNPLAATHSPEDSCLMQMLQTPVHPDSECYSLPAPKKLPKHFYPYIRGVKGMWAVLHENVPYVLSHSHTKRRTGVHGRTRPSSGMTPTFQKK